MWWIKSRSLWHQYSCEYFWANFRLHTADIVRIWKTCTLEACNMTWRSWASCISICQFICHNIVDANIGWWEFREEINLDEHFSKGRDRAYCDELLPILLVLIVCQLTGFQSLCSQALKSCCLCIGTMNALGDLQIWSVNNDALLTEISCQKPLIGWGVSDYLYHFPEKISRSQNLWDITSHCSFTGTNCTLHSIRLVRWKTVVTWWAVGHVRCLRLQQSGHDQFHVKIDKTHLSGEGQVLIAILHHTWHTL